MWWEEVLGKSHVQIENLVDEREGSYQGLSAQALYTSSKDWERIFSHPAVKGTFVDLGSGIGLGCIEYAKSFPQRFSIGIEFSQVRHQIAIELAEKLLLKNTSFICADLLTAEMPSGDSYFLYFPTGPVLDRILSELHQKKTSFTLIVIESHGDLIFRLQKENWLSSVGEVRLSSARHHDHALIFQNNFKERSEELLPHTLSYQRAFLRIEDADGSQWLAESLGLEWTRGQTYQLKFPPRTISWAQVKEVIKYHQLPPFLEQVCGLRHLGLLKFETSHGIKEGHLRKIILAPSFELELSSGEKVEWKEIKSIHQGSVVCYESLSQSFSLAPVPWEPINTAVTIPIATMSTVNIPSKI